MDPEAVLLELLTASDAVMDLVADRIYPEIMPATCYWPALVYTQTASEPERGLSGTHFIAAAQFQLDGWAIQRADAVALRSAVRGALEGKKNVTGQPQYFISLVGTQLVWEDTFQFWHVIQQVLFQHQEEELPV